MIGIAAFAPAKDLCCPLSHPRDPRTSDARPARPDLNLLRK
jgi:hypothetical protein